MGCRPGQSGGGGDSAGGNLTTTLMHDLGERNLPLPKAQVILYAGVDPRLDTQSMRDLRDAYITPSERIDWYLDLYLPADQDRNAPRAAPLFSDHLAGQPDALIIAAGHDPLWDDGLAYTQALRDAGVSVDLSGISRTNPCLHVAHPRHSTGERCNQTDCRLVWEETERAKLGKSYVLPIRSARDACVVRVGVVFRTSGLPHCRRICQRAHVDRKDAEHFAGRQRSRQVKPRTGVPLRSLYEAIEGRSDHAAERMESLNERER